MTSQVTNMATLSLNQETTCNPAIGKWNTGKVTTMERMFDRAFAFNQDIGGWNTSAVTNIMRCLSLPRRS
jgi:surface protein